MKNLKNQQKGFTIIEVMIVLVIAAVILLIVFLAIPALQRNSRNTQRTNDAARLATLVNECLTNRNGVTASCDTAAELSFNAADYGQLVTAPAVVSGNTAPANTTTSAGVWFGRQCPADGSQTAVAASTTPRAYVVLFQLEPNIARCVSGQ